MQAAADQMALALYNARMFNDQRRLAEELYLAKRDADAANRAKSAFLASISHELRTPLHTVIGYSELIQDEAEELGYQEILSDLERIQDSSRHLLTIINDILDFSKIEAGRMELDLDTFSISSLVEEIANSVQPLVAKNGNTLQVRLADDLGTMYSDLTKVRQTLLNLLSNAAKFTEQGEILLSVARESVDGHYWIRVSVADTGIGMTEEQQQQVFEAFVQGTPVTTRKYGGTGLGLAISQRFCQMMGGAISVESTLGQGSTFTVRLPVNAREMSAVHRSPAAETTAHLPAQPHATITQDG
jgi:signal transduction histidine kinase